MLSIRVCRFILPIHGRTYILFEISGGGGLIGLRD